MSDLTDRLGRLTLAMVALTLMLAGCRPTLVPKPDPTPQAIHVSVPPSLTVLGPLLKSCMAELPQAGLIISRTTAPTLEQAGLALRWGAGSSLPGSFAAVLSNETLVFIVHPQNPLEQIPLADLLAIYRGTQNEWPSNGPAGEVQPWAYPAGEDVQQIFTAVAGESFPENASALAPDPAAMIEAVAGSPSAIGYLPRRWLDGRVKEVQIEDLSEDRLRQPILVLSQSEPVGPAKSWLLCLQENLAE